MFRCVTRLASQGARSDAKVTMLVAEVCHRWPRSALERPREGAAERQNSFVLRCVALLASQGARSDAKATKLVAEVCHKWLRNASEKGSERAPLAA